VRTLPVDLIIQERGKWNKYSRLLIENISVFFDQWERLEELW